MMVQWIRFVMVVLITTVLSSCVVKTTNRRVGSRPLNIQDIRVAEGSDKTIVEVEGEGLMLFTTFRLTSPDRLVLEISEVGLGKYNDEIKLKEGPIASIVPVPSGDIHVSRLEFQLSGSVRTDVRPEGLNIVVEVTQLDGRGKAQIAGTRNQFKFFQDGAPPKERALKPPVVAVGKLSGGAVGTLSPPLIPPVPVDLPILTIKNKPPLSAATKVKSIQFIEGKNLKVLIALNGTSAARVFYSDRTKKRIVVDLPGVLKNMEGNRVPGDGRIVRRVRTGTHSNKLRLVIDLLLPVNFTVVRDQDKVEIILKENSSMKTFSK